MRLAGLKLAVASAVALAALANSPARAVTFNLIDVGGAGEGTLARQGFDMATKYWSSVLTDNVTINLQVGFSSLGEGILGSTGSNSQVAYVTDVYDALRADRSSAIDRTAVRNLPNAGADGAINMVVNGYANRTTQAGYTDTRTRVDRDGSGNNVALAVNTANLKALGFTVDANGDPIDTVNPDGEIVFSSDFAFDFDPTDGIATGTSDFIAVAIHEIGHALGFVSGVDTYDLVSGPNSPVVGTVGGVEITYAQALAAGLLIPGFNNLEDFAIGSVLDLFRYNEDGQLDWSTSDARKIFSLNGTDAVYGNGAFSLGAFNGDGNQASHWLQPEDQSTREAACSNFLGIMNPYACSGQGDAVSALDLAAMDAIGWDLAASVRDDPNYLFTTADVFRAFAVSVPEPATWMELTLGFGLLGASIRRSRRIALA